MSARYWIITFVFGVIAGLAQAEEQAGEAKQQAQKEQNPLQTLPIPIPVNIVENQATSEAREREEEETRNREIRDLAAQEGMNAATQSIERATWDMRNYALYSTILVALGTFMLGVTLWLTRQANNAAQQAVSVTSKIGEAETRPWLQCSLDIANGLLEAQGSLPFGMNICIENIGKSPATEVLFDVWLFQEFTHHDDGRIQPLADKLISEIETEFRRSGVIMPAEKVKKSCAEVLEVNLNPEHALIGGVVPSACVVAVYKIPSDKDWHCTATIFDIYIKDQNGIGLSHPFPLDGKAISGDKINVVKRRNAIGT